MVVREQCGPERVVAVVVTYERLPLLRQALAAVFAQDRPVDAVVVVDNASRDATVSAVGEEFPVADLLVLSRNTGGAGGFAVGLQRALDGHGADLVWLLDDDTVPQPDALRELLQVWRRRCDEPPALVASRVVWQDGRDHPMNTPRRSPLASRADREVAAELSCVPVRSASFVSVLLDGRAVRTSGPPIADYFLWNDDFEFTTRLLRGRLGLLCPSSVVVHRTRTFGDSQADPGPRFYYEVRNKVWLFGRSPGLAPLERVLYGGASLGRWARTVRRSRERRALLCAGGRGLRDGLRRGPRSNAEVLCHALPVAVGPA